MRRNALGIIAAFLLVVGFVSMFGGPGGESAKQFSGVCVKTGLVLGALWLALPQITAVLATSPRRILSWLFGKSKPARQTGSSPPPARTRPEPGQPEQQAPRPGPPRPRRRSNS